MRGQRKEVENAEKHHRASDHRHTLWRRSSAQVQLGDEGISDPSMLVFVKAEVRIRLISTFKYIFLAFIHGQLGQNVGGNV